MSKYSIHLTAQQRQQIEQKVRVGQAPAREILHAQVLLKMDKGDDGPRWSDRRIREAFPIGDSTLTRIRRLFVQEGLQAALQRKKQPDRPQKRRLDGAQEANLLLLACSDAPAGQERWTAQLLKERLIELHIVETISDETVRLTLKKTISSRG